MPLLAILAISIHLMLLFNINSIIPFISNFIISIHLMLLFNQHCIEAVRFHFHFNTSNVTIQHLGRQANKERQANFNTSNVTIQQESSRITIIQEYHFNTSNVTIQQNCTSTNRSKKEISIHLMLLFNRTPLAQAIKICVISIHLMLLFNCVSGSA